jgi:histone H3/H4
MAKDKLPQMVVTSRVKDVIKSKKLRSDGQLIEAVNAKLAEMLEAAAARTKANGRSTVRGHDL